MDSQIELIFLVDFPPIASGFAAGKISQNAPLYLAGIQALHSVLLPRFAKGSEGNALKCAVETSEKINYFNQRTRKFLEFNLPIDAQDITTGDVVIVSFSRDADKLQSMVEVRSASPLEIASMEIMNGK